MKERNKLYLYDEIKDFATTGDAHSLILSCCCPVTSIFKQA